MVFATRLEIMLSIPLDISFLVSYKMTKHRTQTTNVFSDIFYVWSTSGLPSPLMLPNFSLNVSSKCTVHVWFEWAAVGVQSVEFSPSLIV